MWVAIGGIVVFVAFCQVCVALADLAERDIQRAEEERLERGRPRGRH